MNRMTNGELDARRKESIIALRDAITGMWAKSEAMKETLAKIGNPRLTKQFVELEEAIDTVLQKATIQIGYNGLRIKSAKKTGET